MFGIDRFTLVKRIAVLGITAVLSSEAVAGPDPRPGPGAAMTIEHDAQATVKKSTGFGYTVTVKDTDLSNVEIPSSTIVDDSLECGGTISSAGPGYTLQSRGPASNGTRKWDLRGTARDTARTWTDSWSAMNPNPDTRRVDKQVYLNVNIQVTE